MIDLIERLKAAIANEEQLAQAAHPGPWRVNDCSDEHILENANRDEIGGILYWAGDQMAATYNHMALHDPISVLRKATAVRQVLELHRPAEHPEHPDGCAECFGDSYPCPTIKLLAAAYGVVEQVDARSWVRNAEHFGG